MSKLSTQEVWEIVHDASDEDVYDYLGGEFEEETREEIVCGATWEKLEEFALKIKAEQEEKRLNPKFEWVDVCRIIEVKNNIKKCVYEEQIILPLSNFSVTALTEKAEEILKKYVVEHDGEFFATIVHNCRVVR